MNISQSSAQCVLHQLRQLFEKLSYSAIDNISTNLLPAGVQNFFQMINVSKVMLVNELLECSTD